MKYPNFDGRDIMGNVEKHVPHLLEWLEAATSDSEVAVALANVVVCSVLDC